MPVKSKRVLDKPVKRKRRWWRAKDDGRDKCRLLFLPADRCVVARLCIFHRRAFWAGGSAEDKVAGGVGERGVQRGGVEGRATGVGQTRSRHSSV